MTQAISPGTLN